MSKCSCEAGHAEQIAAQVVAFIDATDRLHASLTHSSFAIALQGAEVRPINVGGAAGQGRIATSSGRLLGWSLRETAGAQATVYLRDGEDNTADIIGAIELAPHESTRDSWFPGGLSFVRGLFVDVHAGAVEGAVYVGGNGA